MKSLISKGNILIASIIITMTVIAVYLPSLEIYRQFQDYLVHFLIILILLGLLGLIINSKVMLYSAFGCAGILALFLKNASYSEFKNPVINETRKMGVAHINLSLLYDVESVLNAIGDTSITVVSFQEYTPDWAGILPHVLGESFPYSVELVQIDLTGKAIFSKTPIIHKDTFLLGNSPNLHISFLLGKDSLDLYSTYMTPALDRSTKEKANREFNELENLIQNDLHKKILMGEFNQVYWSHDIIDMRNKTKLLNSRKIAYPTTAKMPYDHIFYSKDLECYSFDEIYDHTKERIGCKASFQQKSHKQIKRPRN